MFPFFFGILLTREQWLRVSEYWAFGNYLTHYRIIFHRQRTILSKWLNFNQNLSKFAFVFAIVVWLKCFVWFIKEIDNLGCSANLTPCLFCVKNKCFIQISPKYEFILQSNIGLASEILPLWFCNVNMERAKVHPKLSARTLIVLKVISK